MTSVFVPGLINHLSLIRYKGGITDNLNLSFGTILKARRLDCGFTQEELALKSLMHIKRISRLERGLAEPTLEDLFQLSYATNIDVGEFLNDMIALQITKQ